MSSDVEIIQDNLKHNQNKTKVTKTTNYNDKNSKKVAKTNMVNIL